MCVTVDQSFGKLDTFGQMSPPFVPNGFDIKDSLLDALGKNGMYQQQFKTQQQDRLPFNLVQQPPHGKEMGGNGAVDHMSKFFSDFYKNGGSQPPNGLNGVSHQQNSYLSLADKQALLLLHQQRQIEEQLMNLNLKHLQHQQQGYNGLHVNGAGPYLNGDLLGGQPQQQSFVYGNGPVAGSKTVRQPPEDELDFDPILETQKALAELIENEQNVKMQGEILFTSDAFPLREI